jgi:hypothetical protein
MRKKVQEIVKKTTARGQTNGKKLKNNRGYLKIREGKVWM